jgi:rod shape-determining protein MreC
VRFFKGRSIKGIPADDILVSKVIHNSYNVHENFLTELGSNDGVKQDIGVINDLGIVGIRQYLT